MTATQMQVATLESRTWPITWRYYMRVGSWRTQQDLTVDAPSLLNNAAASGRLGYELWPLVMAPAMSDQVELEYLEMMAWKVSAAPSVPQPKLLTGVLPLPPASRDDAACVLLHTGHVDGKARRRFYLPGIPSRWVHDGLLTDEAVARLESLMQAAFMGMERPALLSPLDWLLAYPGLLPKTSTNQRGVAFRRVTHPIVTYHTDRAPSPLALRGTRAVVSRRGRDDAAP